MVLESLSLTSLSIDKVANGKANEVHREPEVVDKTTLSDDQNKQETEVLEYLVDTVRKPKGGPDWINIAAKLNLITGLNRTAPACDHRYYNYAIRSRPYVCQNLFIKCAPSDL
ncbi:hypothetical protein RQP46_001363 [Phenoliferia psychrophenolica]